MRKDLLQRIHRRLGYSKMLMMADQLAGDGSQVQGVTTTIVTSAQFQSVFAGSGQIQLVPPQGPNRFIDVFWWNTTLKFVTTPYATGTGNLVLVTQGSGLAYGNPNVQIFPTTAINGTGNTLTLSGPGGQSNVQPTSNYVNQGIGFRLSTGAAYTAGDGVFTFRIWYRTILIDP